MRGGNTVAVPLSISHSKPVTAANPEGIHIPLAPGRT